MLDPTDEYLHDPGDAATFNESMYFNFWDHGRRCGGFVRMGNRPNEGYCEVTFTFYLSDGRTLFNYLRPKIGNNDAFNAGGMQFEVLEPLKRLRATYEGTAVELSNPHEMADPKAAFANNRHANIELDMTFDSFGPVYGGRGAAAQNPDEEFARNHYEQHYRATGTMTYDGFEVPLDGFGLRDHSWGPRTWQALQYYRWLNGQFGDDLGFMASHVVTGAGDAIRTGFVCRNGENLRVTDWSLETTYAGDEHYQDAIAARLTLETGEHLDVTGKVRTLLPLRNRRDGSTTRITEGFTQWTCGDRKGYGISEYLDQIVDGVPNGFAAGV